jgi:hypothetical protein
MLPTLELAAAIAELLLCAAGSALDVALLLPPHATATSVAIASSTPTLPECLQVHRRGDGCRCDCIMVAHTRRRVSQGAARSSYASRHSADSTGVMKRARVASLLSGRPLLEYGTIYRPTPPG